MPKEEVSDKELDALIDASIKQGKAEGKEEGKPEKSKKEVTAKKKVETAAGNKPAVPVSDKPASKALVEAKKEQKPKKEAALKPVEGYDPWKVLTYPHLTEKSMNLVERNNVLVFIVSMKATKAKIKEAVEKGFGARVVSVRVEITRKNQKKAYVRLAEGVLASDIATRLGMI